MRRLISLLLFVALLPVHTVMAAELTILTENLPPLNYLEDGKLVGPSVEIVKEIKKRVGCNAPIDILPWARAYRMALEGENVVLFGTTQTESRQPLFKWVGPLATKRDILVGLKGSELKISSLEDAKQVNRIGTLRDDTREHYLIDHGFTNLEPVSDEQQNAKKLILGRIDLWTYKKPGLKTVCDLAGVDYNKLEEVLHLRKIDVSIAFSKKTSDEIVMEWQKAFDEMTQDGTIARIRNRWNLE